MNRRPHLVSLAALLVFAAPSSLHSQQRILLQIRPHAGDTLEVRLDQRVEMTGTTTGATPVARHMTTVTEVFSRAIVRNVSNEGANVLAVTDSIRTSASRGGNPGAPHRVKGGDNTISLRVSTDGGAEVVDADATDEMRAIFGQMPATLSRKAVSVGETWKREMRIPIAGEKGAMGMVRATFQLDSLSDDEEVAYISMRGTLSHDHRDGNNSGLEGWMTGSMQLNRKLGWIVETRATIDVASTVVAVQPMRVRTKVTQLLRARSAR